MRMLAFLLLVTVSSILSGVEPGAERSLRIGCFPNPPAFDVVDGRGAAFFGDLTEAIAEAEGWTIEWVPGTVSEGNARLASGEIDLLPCTSVNPQRQQVMDYSANAAHTGWGQLYTRRGYRAESLLDLKGARIAVVTGNNSGKQFRAMLKAFSVNYHVIEVSTPPEVFAALANNRADAGVVNNIFGDIHRHEFAVAPTGILFHPFQLHYVVPKGRHADLLAAIDARLTEWKRSDDSPHSRLIAQYFSGATNRSPLISQLLVGLALLTALAVLIGAMNLALRAQVKRATKALSRVNARLAATLYSIGDAVIATNATGHIETMNPVACALTAHSLEQAIGKHLDDVFVIVNADSRQKLTSPVTKVLESGRIVGLANHTILIARDGAEHQIADSGAPIRANDGSITGVVLV
nr:transporter substrate-binding domain-containing protein [Planctomycetota bacterium]